VGVKVEVVFEVSGVDGWGGVSVAVVGGGAEDELLDCVGMPFLFRLFSSV
jgi:hypothetical protein